MFCVCLYLYATVIQEKLHTFYTNMSIKPLQLAVIIWNLLQITKLWTQDLLLKSSIPLPVWICGSIGKSILLEIQSCQFISGQMHWVFPMLSSMKDNYNLKWLSLATQRTKCFFSNNQCYTSTFLSLWIT